MTLVSTKLSQAIGFGVALVCGSVLTTGCGSSGDSKKPVSRSSSTSTTRPEKVPTAAEVQAALLTVPDLPTGWGTPPPDDSTDNSATSGQICEGKQSPFLQSVTKQEARFAKGAYLPQLVEVLVATPKQQAITQFAAARALFHSCIGKSWTETDSQGTQTTFTLGEVSAPKIGDESFGIRLTGSFSMGTITVDMVFFRSGSIVGVIANLGGTVVIIGTGQVDVAEWTAILSTAERKVEAATKA